MRFQYPEPFKCNICGYMIINSGGQKAHNKNAGHNRITKETKGNAQ